MQFVHQALTWGFLLPVIPLLIHLINLVRRRRVRWAAMDFLLQSYKRHRTWVWMKQLLLLLMRMAAIAIAVAMLAQWVTHRQWLNLLGGGSTHHYVLLDDSFSMAQRAAGASAFERAEQALTQLAQHAMRQETRQKLTLIRMSAAAAARQETGQSELAAVVEMNAEIVDDQFDLRVEEVRRGLDVTELAVGPAPALALARQLIAAGEDEQPQLYVLSDFRGKDWESPVELRRQLAQIDRRAARIHFVQCAPPQPDNLAITDIRPGSGTRAAGVPLFVNITVRNFGDQPVRKVPVKVRTRFYDPQIVAASQAGEDVADVEELPATLIESIPARQAVTTRVQIQFPRPGPQVIEVALPDDALNVDNRRWCVVDLVPAERVLLVDGTPTQRHAFYLSSVFRPGDRVNTGIEPDVQDASFLRDAGPETLSAYRAIYLLDVPRLDERALARLDEYVRGGGGVAVFAGDHVQFDHYTEQWYRGGDGLFPLPLERLAMLPEEPFENRPDFEVTRHPLFEVFIGENNPFLTLVTIEQYLRPPVEWSPTPDSGVAVLARLRDTRDPLVVEKRVGDGRVVAFLTTLAPQWNNWAFDPSFVAVLLKLQAHLATASRMDERHRVGAALDVALDRGRFAPEVSFVTPGPDDVLLAFRRTAQAEDATAPWRTRLEGAVTVLNGNTSRAGVYEVWKQPLDGPTQVDRYAVNVDPSESDLRVVDDPQLAARLAPVHVEIMDASRSAFDFSGLAGNNRSLLLLGALVVLLIGEQWMAYFTSFHPSRGSES